MREWAEDIEQYEYSYAEQKRSLVLLIRYVKSSSIFLTSCKGGTMCIYKASILRQLQHG